MAEKKHRAAAAAGPDPEGDAWIVESGKRWAAAEAESARLQAAAAGAPGSARERKERARAAKTAIELYDPPALPDFRAAAAKDLKLKKDDEILGRFVFQPGSNLVHDVSKAGPACRIQETPRLFVHFAAELERAIPEDAEPHSCMTA
jgi:hypothetical protein